MSHNSNLKSPINTDNIEPISEFEEIVDLKFDEQNFKNIPKCVI